MSTHLCLLPVKYTLEFNKETYQLRDLNQIDRDGDIFSRLPVQPGLHALPWTRTACDSLPYAGFSWLIQDDYFVVIQIKHCTPLFVH